MKLYICEKPSQGRDLARNLGVSGTADGFIANSSNSNSNAIAITWAVGHLIRQLEPDEIDPKYAKWSMEQLPIIPNAWKLKPNTKTRKQLNVVKGLLKQSNHVVIATDGDREGEVIGRELLDYFNWSGQIDRLWLTALDDKSIQKALRSIKQGVETESLYASGLARQRADWIVGMSATRALSIQAQQQGYRGVLSVGRVQTPTLAIVVNRDLEIENFKPQDYYDIKAVFSGIVASWKASTNVIKHSQYPQHTQHEQHTQPKPQQLQSQYEQQPQHEQQPQQPQHLQHEQQSQQPQSQYEQQLQHEQPKPQQLQSQHEQPKPQQLQSQHEQHEQYLQPKPQQLQSQHEQHEQYLQPKPQHEQYPKHKQHPQHHLYFDQQGRCLNQHYAEQVADKVRAGNASVVKSVTQRKKLPPPLLYSLSALQQAASKKFGFGARQVLDLTQSLYEQHKAVTYPRSDCQYLPTSQLSEIKDVMGSISRADSDMGKLIVNADLTIQSRVWNDKKLGAHHAIIPTSNMQVDTANMSANELKIYTLICSSYISQFFLNYEYDRTDIEISASNETFTSSINVDVNLGWRVVINSQAQLKHTELKPTEAEQIEAEKIQLKPEQLKPTELKHTEAEQTELKPTEAEQTQPEKIQLKPTEPEKIQLKPTKLQQTQPNTQPITALKIKQGQQLNIDSVESQTKHTKPPLRYTEGTLIRAMEQAHLFVTDPNLKKVLKGNEGIGTQATRASIIELLKKRSFLTIKNQQIISSATARALISAVPSAVKDPGMTAIMESSLAKIATSELTLDAFMSWQVDWLNKLIEAIKSQTIRIESNIKTISCPKCGKAMLLRSSKQGQFWGCSGYPECKSIVQNNNGKAVLATAMPNCPECGKQLRRLKGKKNNKGWFWSCTGYFDTPQCKFTAQDKAGRAVFK